MLFAAIVGVGVGVGVVVSVGVDVVKHIPAIFVSGPCDWLSKFMVVDSLGPQLCCRFYLAYL